MGVLNNTAPCGEEACSRWAAQQPHSCERYALKREQAPSPQESG